MPKGKARWFRGRGNNEPDGTDEARIIAVVTEANTSFAEGRFEQACDCYTQDVPRQIEALVGAPDCVQAWTDLHAQLRKSLSPEQFTAPDDLEHRVGGAEGRYCRRSFPRTPGEPPWAPEPP